MQPTFLPSSLVVSWPSPKTLPFPYPPCSSKQLRTIIKWTTSSLRLRSSQVPRIHTRKINSKLNSSKRNNRYSSLLQSLTPMAIMHFLTKILLRHGETEKKLAKFQNSNKVVCSIQHLQTQLWLVPDLILPKWCTNPVLLCYLAVMLLLAGLIRLIKQQIILMICGAMRNLPLKFNLKKGR